MSDGDDKTNPDAPSDGELYELADAPRPFEVVRGDSDDAAATDPANDAAPVPDDPGGAIELEELARPFDAAAVLADHRPHMPEPPPVRLIAVEDVHVVAAADAQRELDRLYITLLQFEREERDEAQAHASGTPVLRYRAENFRLCVHVMAGSGGGAKPSAPRDDYRGVHVEVPSLADLEKALLEEELEYERVRGLVPGEQSLLLRDAAGNFVSVVERKPLM